MHGFLSEFFGFALSLSSHHGSILIFMYKFLFPEGQMEKPGKMLSLVLINIQRDYVYSADGMK